MFHFKLLSLSVFSFAIVSCAGPEAKTIEAPVAPAKPSKPVVEQVKPTPPSKPVVEKVAAVTPIAPVKKVAPVKKLEKPQDPPPIPNSKFNVQKYFYILYPKGQKKPFEDIVFQKKDIQNGYLHITGKYLGHYIFKLFRGDKADFLLEQGVSCAPECEQENTVFNFVNGEIEEDKELDQFYPKAAVDKHIQSLQRKLPRKGEDEEERETWFQVTENSDTIKVLVVDQNPGLPIKGKVNVYEAGELTWNGSRFEFKALNSISPSEIKITDLK